VFLGAGVAQAVYRLGYGLDDRVSIPGWFNVGIFPLHQRVHTGSAANQDFYPIGTGGF